MPAFGGGNDDCALFLNAERRTGLGFGLRQSLLFDRLALAVEPIELAGDLGRFDRIVFEQKFYAEIGAADAAAGIDPRPEQKTEMPRFRRPGKPRHVHQADMTRPFAPAQRDQALGDKSAIEPDERHDVGHGAERDIVKQRQQIGLRAPGLPKPASAQHPIERHDRHERQPDGGEMTEPR